MARKSVLQGRQFKYIKGGMYTLNFFVGVLGLALGSVGIWIRVDFDTDKYKYVLDPVFRLCEEEDHEFEFTISVHMDTITYFLIFLGVAIMATGCVGIGCCGATQGARDYDPKYGHFPCLKKYLVFPCEKAIKDFFSAIEDNMIMMLVVSFCIGLFTLLGMGMSTYLFFALRKAKR
ncbi:hypothetical protein LSH36_979g02008 [Paralvinella palmiformis]|uniref:Tetraspanin n=1 Tax=Paralvinella palmiformis TaxID=53620 RepID=A0AAD9IX25_9ANNE|nr:hypothetical protein LSH36_979g02008 [Paralvinella palmiformis]